MKLEGMDAAARAVTVPVQVTEQTHANAAAGEKKARTAEKKEQVGANANPMKKVRLTADIQAFEKMFQQQEDGESEKVVREAIERANRVLSGSDRKFEISVHEKTKDIMVKVVDTVTNETIREIPPKKIVDLVVRLCEIAGILFDEKG